MKKAKTSPSAASDKDVNGSVAPQKAQTPQSPVCQRRGTAPSSQKAWALAHYKGMENLLMPSFAADFQALDEDGIRRDVGNSIRHGFFSMMLTPIGIQSHEENRRFIKTVCDEAHGKILTGAMVAHADLEADMRMIENAETFGCTHLFVWPAQSIDMDGSEDDAYRVYRERILATQLPVVLYANFAHLRKIGFMLNVFDRLADLPNVVAVKLTQPMNLATAFDVCERLSDRLLIGPVNLDFVPMLSKHYGVQWSGQWNVEAVQSPDKPYAVELMNLLNDGCLKDAMDMYRRLEPALRDFYKLQAPLLIKGGHPWAHMKYFQWCGGGNGGLIRGTDAQGDRVPVLDAAARDAIKETYRKVNIAPVDAPEEAFLTGRAAYAKGVRRRDMTQTPSYRAARA